MDTTAVSYRICNKRDNTLFLLASCCAVVISERPIAGHCIGICPRGKQDKTLTIGLINDDDYIIGLIRIFIFDIFRVDCYYCYNQDTLTVAFCYFTTIITEA